MPVGYSAVLLSEQDRAKITCAIPSTGRTTSLPHTRDRITLSTCFRLFYFSASLQCLCVCLLCV